MSLFQYVCVKVIVPNAECDAHGKMNQEVQTWNDLCTAETEVIGDSEILLDENMRRTKRAGV